MTWFTLDAPSIINSLRYACYSCLCTRSSTSKHGSVPHIPYAQILPTNILARMFIECSEPNLPVVYLPPRRDFYYPWRLGHICSHWRRALWDSSDIWNTIYIVPFQQERLVLDMLDHILFHTSGSISLSINQYSYNTSGVTNIIVSFGHRLKGLTLSHTPHRPLNVLLDLAPDSINHLEALYLFNLHPDLPLSSPNNSHLRFQNLQELGISGNTSIAPYLSHFPVSQLTHLSIAGSMISPTIAHFLLQQSTSLIFADFEICEEVKSNSMYQTKGIITSSIEHIDLAPSFNLDWHAFLKPLILPSLTTFTNSDLSRPPIGLSPTFLHAMYNLIHRSNCSLKFFSTSSHFKSPPIPNLLYPEIAGLLYKMPNLTTFISGYILESSFISSVYELLPKLEVIDWKVKPDGLHIVLNMLDDYISQPPGSPMQFPSFINIICCNGNGFISGRARYLEKYKAYEEAGVYITVRSAEYDDMRFLDRLYVD